MIDAKGERCGHDAQRFSREQHQQFPFPDPLRFNVHGSPDDLHLARGMQQANTDVCRAEGFVQDLEVIDITDPAAALFLVEHPWSPEHRHVQLRAHGKQIREHGGQQQQDDRIADNAS